ncbi:efflux RND transporter periplasmic adaptor subunit [candidate division WOR-3 bacterium]|uniref:Efflux RND transporter periplasmic adaptor subunit n=1 Tax=candidate division WOR-3 bacterium TaxID=2052148 RepID=A0A9D5KC66_UNCW3|nr:efflux RND transporter periplasmic adaptor subunit [candidate division WOR-3 bacterium]MBD3365031.1 efflux RND transporter periplasmic adaptor subunit [candidate division WOR-3 bacterium]
MEKKKKRRRRIGLWIGIGIGAVIVLLILLNIIKPTPAPEVSVISITPSNIVSTVSGTGELRAANQVDISAEKVARVERLYVSEGDLVTKGQMLCLLDDESARSTRNLNLANFNEARSAYERGKVLFSEELISEAEFDKLTTVYEVAKAQLAQSQDNLDKTRIYAPISGRIVALNIEEGETVMMGTMNNPGTVIMTVADLSAMQARIDVDESDVVDLDTGQRAKVILDAMPDTTFAAVVSNISYTPNTSNLSSTAEGVTDFEVILDLTDVDPAQRPGMSVSADIVTARRDSVIVCPLQAIGRKEVEGELKETVFLVEDGTAKLAVVQTGIDDGRSIEIIGGIEDSQTVIIGPYKILRTLEEGAEVKTQESELEWQDKRRKGPKPKVEVKVERRGT